MGTATRPGAGGPASSTRPSWARLSPRSTPGGIDARGFGVHIHAIGDRAVRKALDAIAAARAANGRGNRRHHIAHLQVIHPEDVPRFRELGVLANCQPLWASNEPQMTELTLPFRGPERSAWQYPLVAWRRRATVLRQRLAGFQPEPDVADAHGGEPDHGAGVPVPRPKDRPRPVRPARRRDRPGRGGPHPGRRHRGPRPPRTVVHARPGPWSTPAPDRGPRPPRRLTASAPGA